METDTAEASQTQQEIDHDLFIRRRRLPSPISEDESMESPTTIAGGMLHRLDMDHEENALDIVHEGNALDMGHEGNALPASAGTATEAPGSKPRPVGRRENGVEKKGKLTLSMGYRADCEKCKNKVPGHYSHFLAL